MRWFWVVWLLILPSVLGVTIHGTVYDFGLTKLTDSIVEIDTSPKQQMVAKNGTYSFSVPTGTYTLKASHKKSDSDVIENISALTEGNYVLDLILLPSLEGEEALLQEELEVPMVEDIIEEKPVAHWLLWLIVFLILGWLVYKMSRRPEQIVEKVVEKIKEVREVTVSEELQKVMELIEKEGGRITQKDIRKNFPYSEAKISLMIDDLEAKGLIKKVKKGRGNLIIKS